MGANIGWRQGWSQVFGEVRGRKDSMEKRPSDVILHFNDDYVYVNFYDYFCCHLYNVIYIIVISDNLNTKISVIFSVLQDLSFDN